jgi:hypothetical protein
MTVVQKILLGLLFLISRIKTALVCIYVPYGKCDKPGNYTELLANVSNLDMCRLSVALR